MIALFASQVLTVSAELIITKTSCNDGLSFVVDNTGGYDFRSKDFTIIGTHASGKKVKFDGVWRNLADDPTLAQTGRIFLSNMTMPFYGDYTINVTRVRQIDTFLEGGTTSKIVFSESSEFDVACEEQAFECNKIDLKIDDCYTANGRYYGIFSGIQDQSGFYPYNRFNFKFVGRAHIYENETPEGLMMNEISPGRYYATFPVSGKTDWTSVGINGCDDKRYERTSQKIECRTAITCTDDSQCDDFEYCNTDQGGICEVNLCNICEKPKNHACVPKCDDANLCTADTCEQGFCKNAAIPNCCMNSSDCGQNTLCKTNLCVDNRCALSQKECNETNDPCIVGKCDDEKGCTYQIDENCRVGWLQKIIDWFRNFFN